MCYDEKSSLRVTLYVTNSLLIIKGLVYIILMSLALTVLAIALSSNKGGWGAVSWHGSQDILHVANLYIYGTLLIGIFSLIIGICGIIAASTRNIEMLIVNVIVLFLIASLEVAICSVLAAYGLLQGAAWEISTGVTFTLLTIITMCLTMVYQCLVQRSSRRYA